MTFRALHDAGLPLLLPNAWDVASALGFLDAGFAAIGTTSFGVAAAAGHPDGERSTRQSNQTLARSLARLPGYVSVDVEDGYSDDPDEVAAYVAGLGVDGVNIEDSTAERLVAPEEHAAKVATVKRHSPDLFVNARTDTYWLGQDATVEATLARAKMYVDAGADGVFVPGATDPDELRELTSQLPVPVNVLVIPGLSLTDLGRLGIQRVSTGSLPYRSAIDAAVRVALDVRAGRPVPSATPYPDMQQRLARYQPRSSASD